MRKFKMANVYFSKALRFLEVSQTVTPNLNQNDNKSQLPWQEVMTQPQLSGTQSQHEQLGNTTSQHTIEILFNMGISLYKDGNTIEKLENAFHCFEKTSNALKGNPKLWYYMALTVIKMNRQLRELLPTKEAESDVFQGKFGFTNTGSYQF